ncbi:hypothetical protein EON68_00460 [archaeon]|nr:MAG: hypothetical protein EON68_00460 [archaeon]
MPISTADVARGVSQQTHVGVDWHGDSMDEEALMEELRLQATDGAWSQRVLDEQIKLAEKTWALDLGRFERDDASGSCSSSSDEESDADE